MEKKFESLKKMTLRQAEKFLESGRLRSEFNEQNTAYSEEDREALYKAALSLSEARKFIDEFSKKERFATDTFRYGFIGKKVNDEHGTEYVQVSRGSPYGSIAAVYDEKTKKIYAGFTYVSEDERFPHSVIGQAIALRRAIENRDKDIDIESIDGTPWLKGTDELQWKHFKDRVYRYFRPDEFSHSRGKTPTAQPKFDEIHIWQYVVEAQHAKDKKSFKELLKKIESSLTELNPKLK